MITPLTNVPQRSRLLMEPNNRIIPTRPMPITSSVQDSALLKISATNRGLFIEWSPSDAYE